MHSLVEGAQIIVLVFWFHTLARTLRHYSKRADVLVSEIVKEAIR